MLTKQGRKLNTLIARGSINVTYFALLQRGSDVASSNKYQLYETTYFHDYDTLLFVDKGTELLTYVSLWLYSYVEVFII